MPGKERRKRTRVDFKTQIVVEANGSKVHAEGSSKDLSLSGVFIHTHEALPSERSCRVQVVLAGTDEPLVLEMDGHVVRSDASGMAVAFDSMDLDSYTHLKNIVRYNVANPDKIH